MPMPVIVDADLAERPRCIATLVSAFVADPLIRWMLPEPQQYLAVFPRILRHFAGGAFDHGTACRSADFTAGAMWLPPGAMPDEEALGAVMQDGIAADRRQEVFAFMEQVGGGHPHEPHWYLPAIGVDPMRQGLGLGSALLARSLARCDRDHAAAYLEATNPRNVPLYERFGFKVVGRLQAGSSPAIVTMKRAAR